MATDEGLRPSLQVETAKPILSSVDRTNAVFGDSTTLVNDTVVLVNDTTALVGGSDILSGEKPVFYKVGNL